MLMRNAFLLIAFLFIAPLVKAQLPQESLWKEVVEKGIKDSLFVFGKWDDQKREDELRLKYLGQFKTKDGRVLKLLTSTWLWGSGRATNRILFYNEKNQYVGQYTVDLTWELPVRMRGSIIYFSNESSKCSCSRKRKEVNLFYGLPRLLETGCNTFQFWS